MNFPNFRRYGANNNAKRTYPPVQPIKYTDPSYPENEIRPAIEMNDAADIQSAAVANPFARGETPPPAT